FSMNSKFIAGLLTGIVATLLLGALLMGGMMSRGGMMRHDGMMRQDDMMQNQGSKALPSSHS
ncbi:MAG: hypothetical protein WA947_10755, partial [Phormidesmis sp.]